ncbi:hypothetical protein MRX96_012207 [Rhipicephalus microplus]
MGVHAEFRIGENDDRAVHIGLRLARYVAPGLAFSPRSELRGQSDVLPVSDKARFLAASVKTVHACCRRHRRHGLTLQAPVPLCSRLCGASEHPFSTAASHSLSQAIFSTAPTTSSPLTRDRRQWEVVDDGDAIPDSGRICCERCVFGPLPSRVGARG